MKNESLEDRNMIPRVHEKFIFLEILSFSRARYVGDRVYTRWKVTSRRDAPMFFTPIVFTLLIPLLVLFPIPCPVLMYIHQYEFVFALPQCMTMAPFRLHIRLPACIHKKKRVNDAAKTTNPLNHSAIMQTSQHHEYIANISSTVCPRMNLKRTPPLAGNG